MTSYKNTTRQKAPDRGWWRCDDFGLGDQGGDGFGFSDVDLGDVDLSDFDFGDDAGETLRIVEQSGRSEQL